MFYSSEKSISSKNPVLLSEKFSSPVLPRKYAIRLPHLIILFPLYYLSCGHLQEVKNKGKCQTCSSKSGHGRLWEVVAYKRFQIHVWWFDLETFGICGLYLWNYSWSLRRGGCLWEVVTTRGSTVCATKLTYLKLSTIKYYRLCRAWN